jgi:hypothetical protein
MFFKRGAYLPLTRKSGSFGGDTEVVLSGGGIDPAVKVQGRGAARSPAKVFLFDRRFKYRATLPAPLGRDRGEGPSPTRGALGAGGPPRELAQPIVRYDIDIS